MLNQFFWKKMQACSARLRIEHWGSSAGASEIRLCQLKTWGCERCFCAQSIKVIDAVTQLVAMGTACIFQLLSNPPLTDDVQIASLLSENHLPSGW